MPFNKEIFLDGYENLMDLEKAVFDETMYDLNIAKTNEKTEHQGVVINLLPYNRILDDRILKRYDLKNTDHQYAFTGNRWTCLDILEKAGVISHIKENFANNELLFVNMELNLDAFDEVKRLLTRKDETKDSIIAYRLLFDERSRTITFEDTHEIFATLQFNGIPERIFSYIYQNPNRTVTADEIDTHVFGMEEKSIVKDLDDILIQIGFVKDMAKIFTPSKGKNYVYFRNPVYYSDLKNDRISYVSPKKLIQNKGRKRLNKVEKEENK